MMIGVFAGALVAMAQPSPEPTDLPAEGVAIDTGAPAVEIPVAEPRPAVQADHPREPELAPAPIAEPPFATPSPVVTPSVLVPPPPVLREPMQVSAEQAAPSLGPRVAALAEQLIPTLNRRSPRAMFGLTLLALIALTAAGAARRFRARLRSEGVLPSLMVGFELFGRVIAVLVGVTILVALLPLGISPALTWIAIGAAVAVGWSVREILPDVLAWVVLTTEGDLARGVWIRTADTQGEIDSFTLRSIRIVDAHGQRISIPNRLLLRQPIQATTDSYPKTRVTLNLPGMGADEAREVLREATMLSAWLAPGASPELGQDPLNPARWHVAVQLLEGAYEDDFEGSFPERVREVEASRASERTKPPSDK